MTFSETELDQYRQQGFVLVPGAVDRAALDAYDVRFNEIVSGDVAKPENMRVMRDVMVVRGAVNPPTPVHGVNKLLNFEDDPVLSGYPKDPAILDRVHALVGAQVYSIATNVFNKPPGIDGRHPLHQDLLYFRIRPAEGIVGTWTAISPCTRENGCLAIIPGSHLGELRKHADPDWEYVNRGFVGIAEEVGSNRQYVEMAPGDTLFFHPLLVHGSGQNRSQDFRRAISAHFASDQCVEAGRNWRQGRQVRLIG